MADEDETTEEVQSYIYTLSFSVKEDKVRTNPRLMVCSAEDLDLVV